MINFKEIYTASNLLSLFRLFLAIPLWFLIEKAEPGQTRWIPFFICVFAAITDLLDGYLARKFNQITEFGKIIDPLADKVVIAFVILKLYIIGDIQPYYFLMVILRDLLIFIGGILLTKKIKKVLPSNYLGKAAAFNIGIVILFIMTNNINSLVFQIFYISSIVLIFVSLAAYIIRAAEFMRK